MMTAYRPERMGGSSRRLWRTALAVALLVVLAGVVWFGSHSVRSDLPRTLTIYCFSGLRAVMERVEQGGLDISWVGDRGSWPRAFKEKRPLKDLARQGVELRCGSQGREVIKLSSLFADCVDPVERRRRRLTAPPNPAAFWQVIAGCAYIGIGVLMTMLLAPR